MESAWVRVSVACGDTVTSILLVGPPEMVDTFNPSEVADVHTDAVPAVPALCTPPVVTA